MALDWLFHPLRGQRRRKLINQPFPAPWLPIVNALPFYRALDEAGQQRIRDILRVLVAEKDWEACGGLELTDEIKVTIAAQASLLLLNIQHTYYHNVKAILVYPSAYRTMPRADASGVVLKGRANLGEAWQGRGPVVLSWDAAQHGALDARDGHNLVLHEFAHKLDMKDGLADGTPPFRDRSRFGAWVATMTQEYRALCNAAERNRATLLDHYGATNPAEFFAVATECFFEKGAQLKKRHASLYAVLQNFYQQDPAARRDDGAP
jgi:Mlc titration factor MtfA (ptsG expression regulator)